MVDYELSGRNAVITGASAGIGLGIAMSLAAQGVNLLLVSRDEERLKLSVKEISSKFKVQVDYVPGDVGEISLIKKVDIKIKENFSKCDILVNNAGGPPMGGFLEHGEEAWQSAKLTNITHARIDDDEEEHETSEELTLYAYSRNTVTKSLIFPGRAFCRGFLPHTKGPRPICTCIKALQFGH